MKPRRKLQFEQRILLRILLATLPAVAICVALIVWQTQWTVGTKLLVGAAVVLWCVGFGLAARRVVIYHLQTLSNLLEALREGDYSLRGRRAGWGDALGEVTLEINLLSEHLRAERLEAREASALLGKIVEQIDIAVMAFDGGRRLQLINPAGERLFGQSAAKLIGRTASGLELDGLLSGQTVRVEEHEFPGAAGRWEIHHGMFREGGRPHHLLVISDLSRALREEERKAWQRLIRVMGHEINNSLAPIKSISATLADLLRHHLKGDLSLEEIGAETVQGLQTIGERSAALARFMAAYARVARLPEPDKTEVALRQLVRRVANLTDADRVRCQGPEITLSADADQLEQALINLVKNALEAAPNESVTVRWQPGSHLVALEIIDRGPGIANTDNLFVPFYSTKAGGSGIGLILSRQIAEAHAGSLTLSNRSNASGSIARLVLPLRD